MSLDVAITGATGYLGCSLASALVRPGAAARAASGTMPIEVDVFDVPQLRDALRGAGTAVHLIGTPHPNPDKSALYALARMLPATRDTARRLGLVTLAPMTRALRQAVENPPAGTRIVEVPEIRAA